MEHQDRLQENFLLEVVAEVDIVLIPLHQAEQVVVEMEHHMEVDLEVQLHKVILDMPILAEAVVVPVDIL